MKKIFKPVLATLLLLTAVMSCRKVDNLNKVDDLPLYVAGVSAVLSSSASTIAPALADSNNSVITFSWTSPKYSQDPSLYKFIIEIDSTGRNFAKENTRTVSGVLSSSFTGRELNAILVNLGLKPGVQQSIDVRLISSYNNNNERYMSNVVTVKVTPFPDPSVLFTENAAVTCTILNAGVHSNTFTWTPMFKGTSQIISYTLQYDSAGKNFVTPFEMPFGASVLTKGFNQDTMNLTALNSGIPGGNTGKVEYRIKAVTATGITLYSNVVNVTITSYVPILRVYLPGGYQSSTGNGNDWDPPTAPELIRDIRSAVFNKMYYIYIFLPANAEFKITIGRSWNINYGGSGGNLVANGANFTVPAAGYYRIVVDIANLKYDIKAGRMGFVGGATGAGWNPPGVFPTYALGNAGTNLFVGLTNFTSGGWKLIDSDQWDNGSMTPAETHSYGTAGGDGSTLQINGANFNDYSSAGRYRVIWDGRDRDNIKYFTSPATEMRLVGDGMNVPGVNDWDPPTSPQMTYNGNGVWTITVALKANKDIKFLAGNAWGAFDYEDNSGGSQALGTPRKIVWDGGPNFKTPTTAGTYTITLNENLQTVTIN